MKFTINLLKIFIISFIFLFLMACATMDFAEIPDERETGPVEEKPVQTSPEKTEKSIDEQIFDKYPALKPLFEEHGIYQLDGEVQNKFVSRYEKTLDKKYKAQGSRTFCTAYFYDYYDEIGYGDILGDIQSGKGQTMVEKILNYEKANGGIRLVWTGYEAQQLANRGKEVGVIGEYYYDKAEKYFTRHYSVVQPSMISYNENGEAVPYYVTGLITKRKDVNGRYGTGAFLAQTGVANGLIDFRWAYNRKMNGIVQVDKAGNVRGGILFVVFPEKGMMEGLHLTMADKK